MLTVHLGVALLAQVEVLSMHALLLSRGHILVVKGPLLGTRRRVVHPWLLVMGYPHHMAHTHTVSDFILTK